MSEITDALDSALTYIGEHVPEDYPRDVISYSSLKEIDVCPTRWKLRYMDGIKGPRTNAMLVGLAVHRGIEAHYNEEDAERTALDYLRDNSEGTMPIDKLAKALTVVQRVVLAYTDAYPEKKRDAVELRTEVSLGNGVRLEAVTDLLVDGCIIDHKTSSSSTFEPDPLQLVFNALTLHHNGHTVTSGEIRQLRKDVVGKANGGRTDIVIAHPFDLDLDLLRKGTAEIVRRLDEISARLRLNTWSGPNGPEPDRVCEYQCSILDVFACPAAGVQRDAA